MLTGEMARSARATSWWSRSRVVFGDFHSAPWHVMFADRRLCVRRRECFRAKLPRCVLDRRTSRYAMLLAFEFAASCADVGAGTDKRGGTHDSGSVRPDLGTEPAGRGHDAAGVAQIPIPDAAVIPDATVKPDAAVTPDATVVRDIVDAGCANAIVSDAARTTCSERADSPAVQPPLSLSAEWRFPDEALVDWVSYVEQLAVVTVLSESEIPPPPEVTARGEGYIGRSIVVRIDRTVWLNRGVTAQVADLRMTVFGWVLRSDGLFEAVPGGVPRLRAGGRYVVALTRSEDDGLALLTDRSVMAFAGDPVSTQDVAERGQSDVARQLSMRSLEEVPALLDETPRDPLVERFWDLPPTERVRAVGAARN